MDNSDIKKTTKSNLSKEIATRTTDPQYYAALAFLPNPDTVLRKIGKDQEVYDAVIADAHVIGELRSIRSGMLRYKRRIQAASDSPIDMQAFELCQKVMDHRPAPGMRWADAIWNMAHAVFRGYMVHEIVWEKQGQYLVPGKVVDRPGRRFKFSPENMLLLKTRGNPMNGEELGDQKWLLTRHMPSFSNPYGVALLSSCFWPYMFKHNGFKYFAKLAERFGIPWTIGEYPQGTPKKEQDELADALANMVEAGVAAIPEGGAVKLLEAKVSKEPVHAGLINICNKEMSKALTSQTLAMEIQGEGSRAASETHKERGEDVNESDRSVICDTFNEMFRWITEINFAGANPPTYEFYNEAKIQKDLVAGMDQARKFVQVPVSHAHKVLQIPIPKDGEDVLPMTGNTTAPAPEFARHECPGCGMVHHEHAGPASEQPIDALTEQAASAADKIIETMAKPIVALLKNSTTPEEFRDGLVEIYPAIDDERLAKLTEDALLTGMLEGMDDAGS